MKVRVQGAGEVTLGRGDFVASGGEGSVYARRGIAYKLYADRASALVEGKLRELAAISDPRVVRPERLLLDVRDGDPIGYTMRHVAGAYALCQLVPRAFQVRHGLAPGGLLHLFERMRGAVEAVHRAGVLVVDLNEMNVLVEGTLDDVAFIDTDSWRTPSYPATAQLPAVRDWLAPPGAHDELTDWFSFAVVTFQLFVGIHPYKGRHPDVKGLEERMRRCISVFDPSVSVPRACRSLDTVPAPLRSWYEAVLQSGERSAPPCASGGAAPRPSGAPAPSATGGKALRLTGIASLAEPVLGFWERHGRRVLRTQSGFLVDGRWVPVALEGDVAVGFTRRGNRPILATARGGITLVDAMEARPIPLALHGEEIMASGGRLYVRCRTRVVELDFHEGRGLPVALVGKTVATVLEHAARLYPGCVLQDLLGACYASLLPRAGVAHQVRLPALDGDTVVDARFERGVLVVVSARGGEYHRRVFRFDDQCSTHDVRAVTDVAPGAPELVTLENGTCVCLGEDGDLEVFSRRPHDPQLERIADDALTADVRLVVAGGRAAFVSGASVVQMALR